MMRRLALVGPLDERRAVHTSGYPLDPEQMLPAPDVVLLIDDGSRGVMLFRYTAYGEFSGDTLHANVAEALEQATFEYRDALLPWMDVPEDITDAHLFAIKYAAEELKERG